MRPNRLSKQPPEDASSSVRENIQKYSFERRLSYDIRPEEALQKVEAHCADFKSQLAKAKVAFDRRYNAEEFQERGKLKDFNILSTLSKGAYGTVVLTTLANDPSLGLAMKILEKRHLIKKNCVRQALSEIRILDAVEFTFLVHLHYYFKDNVYIFLVMQFVNGGDMFMLLKSVRKFDETRSKFYAAQVKFVLF